MAFRTAQTTGEILQFIRAYVAYYDHAPRLREIADAFGMRSEVAALHHLDALEEAGFLSLNKRGIVLMGPVSDHAVTSPQLDAILARMARP